MSWHFCCRQTRSSRLPQVGAVTTTLQTLEWDVLLQHAIDGACSEPGRAKLAVLSATEMWAQNKDEAVSWQLETQEMRAFLDREALWGVLRGLKDSKPSLGILKRGGVLSLGDLRVV